MLYQIIVLCSIIIMSYVKCTLVRDLQYIENGSYCTTRWDNMAIQSTITVFRFEEVLRVVIKYLTQ